MQKLNEKVEGRLSDLAWSLWTELGVAGVQRRHREYLIAPEELILFTAAIGDADPRLREEALDWCSRNHFLISINRLKTLAKAFGDSIVSGFSLFAATLNSIAGTNWPILKPVTPLKYKPSGKSQPPEFERSALVLFRLRSLFGVGARADLMAFFLAQEERDFAISDTVEVGYSKRNLASMLEGFARAGVFKVTLVRNQQRYKFIKREEFIKILSPFPKYMPSWRYLFEVILKVRDCLRRTEKKTEDTRAIEMQNLLMDLEPLLPRLILSSPPSLPEDPQLYWSLFSKWVLNDLLAID